MPRLSKLIEKLEDHAEQTCAGCPGKLKKIYGKGFACLKRRCGSWYARHKAKLPFYIPTGLAGWYFYGMFLNSLRLGTAATFHTSGEEIESIWVFNPFQNWFALFTPYGLGVTAVVVLLICLITKKGYIFFSGYKFIRDPRGFDILPDATHGSSGFLTEKEMAEFLEVGPAKSVTGMMLGKVKRHEDDPEEYASYVAHRMIPGNNNNLLCIGAPGSGKSRGLIIPFLLGCAQRSSDSSLKSPESVIVTDPKGELFEKMSPYFREKGFNVKAINFLDMAHSDGWNCLYSLDTETQLVQTVANTIIQNTSGPKEADDFWSRAELNLLMALIHYVCNLKDEKGNLLPIEQRGLGDVYRMLAEKSINDINRTLAELPADHPAKGHHGLFLKARENLWGNIAIGLGNRLAIFQNPLVDKITRNHDVDLLEPGKKPCAYFVIISAQDSAYRFLSSLFFSLAFPRLSDYARLECGGRLPVLVNFVLDEFCNIGYMDGISDVFNSVRGFNMSCQVVVQSLSQWAEKYPGKDWENQLNTFDQTLYMGCNDLTSAEYISKKCGKVTISVTNNQMPLQPLFSPVYSSTRSYSQTRSNTQRDLMQPDEILRLDTNKCIALFNHHKPALLYKLTPEELLGFSGLSPCRVKDYVPAWKQREEQIEREREARRGQVSLQELSSGIQLEGERSAPAPARMPREPDPIYDLPDLKKTHVADRLGMVERPAGQAKGGMVEASLDDVLGDGECRGDLRPRS